MIAVIGGGVGGLACAVDLLVRGHRVCVLERSHSLGGKMREVQVGGVGIGAGPTVLTMRWVFDALFRAAGTRIDEHLQLKPLQRLARHAWTDGSSLDLFSDPTRSYAAIRSFAGEADAQGYTRFCEYTQRIYETVEGPFIRSDRPGVKAVMRSLGFRGVARFLTVDWQRTMWRALEDFFPDPRLRQLFGRYATYYGSSPLHCPATLNLIAHVERSGVWSVEGGMARLVDALVDLIRSLGGEICTRSEVHRIELDRGRVRAVHVAGGAIPCQAAVVNAAPSILREGRLGEEVRLAVPGSEGPRSLSAVTWMIRGHATGRPLAHHNVFFSRDYPAEFNALFDRRRLAEEATVYLCAHDRSSEKPRSTDAGDGSVSERFLCLINAPADGDDARGGTSGDLDRAEDAAHSLMERCGLRLHFDPRDCARVGPEDFNRLFPTTGGALYGNATHSSMAAFQRPEARTKIPGLYLAGGGAHPGAGVPMVALSGRIAAAAVSQDLGA